MFDRRSFLGFSVATGLGLPSLSPACAVDLAMRGSPDDEPQFPNEFERALSLPNAIDVLGRPRCWSLVRDGLHPISPERVVVMSEEGCDSWLSREVEFENRLGAYLAGRFDLPAGQTDLIVHLMDVMTAHYHSPQLAVEWAAKMTMREALVSTNSGHGFGCLCQFQNDGLVQVVNSPVDWWLVLFPEGVDWGSCEPVFGMIGHVFVPYHSHLAALKVRTYSLPDWVGKAIANDSKPDAWEKLAKLDRVSAARTINRAIAHYVLKGAVT